MNNTIQSLLPEARIATPFVDQKSIIHGGDYNPEQWLPMEPTILEQDAELMRQTGINSATVGVFSWASLEPSEGVFTFDWLDRVMDQQARIGNRVILSTPSAAMPIWLGEKYPEVRRVNQVDYRPRVGIRQSHCWTSPLFREKVRIINTKLAERYAAHPALAMWHVSNELCGQCHCELCRTSWAQWLQARYKTLDQMNEAHWAAIWSKHATAWHHVDPTCGYADGVLLDWLRFLNDQYIGFYKFEADILRPYAPQIPITTNFMSTVHGIDYQKFARVVDVIADDQYTNYDPDHPKFLPAAQWWSCKLDLYRCMKPDRTGMLMEACPGIMQSRTPMKVKRPGIHRLDMMQVLAHGADGTCYFQFRAGRGGLEKLHGAVVEHWGTKRHAQSRRFQTLRNISDTYEKLAGILGTTVRPEVAMVYDMESRWAQQLTPGLGIDNPPRNTNLREVHYFDEVFTEQYEPMWSRGIPVDVIPNDRDLSSYKLVILPMHWIMTSGLASRLAQYVRNGGVLVATWDTAMADEYNRMHIGGWPGAGLTEVFGLWVEEMDRLAAGTIRAINGLPGAGRDVAALAHLEGAEAIATFSDDFYAGRPAVTCNIFGQGRAYFIGTRLDQTARSALYGRLLQEIGCQKIFRSDLPVGVTAQIRGDKNSAYLFLLNFTKLTQPVQIDPLQLLDLDTNQTFSQQLQLEPLASRVFKVI